MEIMESEIDDTSPCTPTEMQVRIYQAGDLLSH